MDKKINNCGCGGELPVEVFEQHEQKGYCVMCRDCGCKGGTSINSNSAIALWNTAHPEISNAMQAVKWLEEGKAIYNDNYNRFNYFRQVNGCLTSYNKMTNCVDSTNVSIEIRSLLFHSWQLYEEPKYKETSFIYAFTKYLKEIKVTAYFKDEDEEYTLQENDENGIGLSNARLDESKCLTTEIIQKAVWRIYEN